jgi:hypothetical protein
MKKYLVLLPLIYSTSTWGQTMGPLDPAMGETLPPSSCLGCPGEIWTSENNVFQLDNNLAFVSLQPFGNCFQSTCFYSRFLYASNFGFSIPGIATITGITADIHRQSGNVNSTTDSTVQLGQNGFPVGNNLAVTSPWPLTGAYYTYGGANDLWGATWTPSDINSPAFGLYLKVYNLSMTTTTPTVNHIRITVDYTLASGVHQSQTSAPIGFHVYVSEQEIQFGFVPQHGDNAASVKIYDQLGQLNMRKDLTGLKAGANHFSFSRSSFSAGVYFAMLEAGGRTLTKKFIIQN